MDYEVVIIGSGIAGITTALSLDPKIKIGLLTKKNLEDCNSYLAQGGICVLRNKEDREAFIEDTMKAGHYKNTLRAVETLVENSEEAIEFLLTQGVQFTKENNELHYTKEGGHSTARILHCDDATGRHLMDALISKLRKRKNIDIMENTSVEDIIKNNNKCIGVIADGKPIYGKDTILATGGLGGIFKHSTNFSHITGDGIAMAIRNNVNLKDISYIQTHPTSLYEKREGRRFLISESVRGEGAVLLNRNKKSFTDELKPRDVVTKNILKEMQKDESPYEFLSMAPIGKDRIPKRFPMIFNELMEKGIDPREELVKIVPAEHYTMGGIETDLWGKTSLNNLFAVGEVAATGVHGSNRLASNSLLEGVVFGMQIAKYINNNYIIENKISYKEFMPEITNNYIKHNKEENKQLILERIKEDENLKKFSD